MRYLISVLVLTLLVIPGLPVDAKDSARRRLEGVLESVDRTTRMVVVEGITVRVPIQLRKLRMLRTGEPVFIELAPGDGPARAIRIEPIPD